MRTLAGLAAPALLALLVLLARPVPVGAQTEGQQLQGLEALAIAVAPLGEQETDCGLTQTRIRATAHNFLTTRRIALANDAPTILLFEASSLQDEEADRCMTGLNTTIYRQADYYRESDGTVVPGFVLLWSDLRLAVSPVDDHALFVLGQVQGQLEQFMEDLRRDNGPQ